MPSGYREVETFGHLTEKPAPRIEDVVADLTRRVLWLEEAVRILQGGGAR
jgi:hypothetical protein